MSALTNRSVQSRDAKLLGGVPIDILSRVIVTLPLVKYWTPFGGYESRSISICVDAQCVSLLVDYVLFQTDILRIPHCQIAEWIFKF